MDDREVIMYADRPKMFGDFRKVVNVFDSCRTWHHYQGARKMLELYRKMYKDEHWTHDFLIEKDSYVNYRLYDRADFDY